MPVIAWIGIVVSFLVALGVVFFVIRTIITLALAKREMERPHSGAGVVEIKGPARPRRRQATGASAAGTPSEEDLAMKEALAKLESRARSRKGVEAKQRPKPPKEP